MDARTCRARAGGRGRRTCSRRHHPAVTRSYQQRQHLAGMTPCRSQWEQWGSQETDAWGIRRCRMRSIGCPLGHGHRIANLHDVLACVVAIAVISRSWDHPFP
jgi:hypothetical protein